MSEPSTTNEALVRKPPTLAQEWVLISFCVVFLAFLIVVFSPFEGSEGGNFFLGIAVAFAHAMFISTDIKRRGERVGAWRFFAFFASLVAVVIYLMVTYRFRSLYLIPLYFGMLALVGLPMAILGAASEMRG